MLTRHLILFFLLLEVLSCGAVNSTTAIIDARRQIELAKAKEADIYASYEFTKATLYLKKAKELQGYTEYQQSVIYAINAKDHAKASVKEGMARKQKLKKIEQLKKHYHQ